MLAVICKYYPFYIRDLNIHEFWYLQCPGTNSPHILKDDYILFWSDGYTVVYISLNP